MSDTSPQILVIEDEDAVRIGLRENLQLEGFKVLLAETGEQGLEIFREKQPDLVILDVMMPGLDGLEVCRQIRLSGAYTPIIMLTAKCGEVDKVVGLELGADDYLTKPFGMRELFARVKALLRRSQAMNGDGDSLLASAVKNGALRFGEVSIDFKTYRAFRGALELELSAREFELIKFLASRCDIPVTRDQLLDSVWGYNSYPTTRTVDNFIRRLRSKVEPEPDRPRYILTVHGVGYKFVHEGADIEL